GLTRDCSKRRLPVTGSTFVSGEAEQPSNKPLSVRGRLLFQLRKHSVSRGTPLSYYFEYEDPSRLHAQFSCNRASRTRKRKPARVRSCVHQASRSRPIQPVVGWNQVRSNSGALFQCHTARLYPRRVAR